MHVYSGHALSYTELVHRHATQIEGSKFGGTRTAVETHACFAQRKRPAFLYRNSQVFKYKYHQKAKMAFLKPFI